MDAGTAQWALLTVSVTAAFSLITAVLTAFLTSKWSLRREHEADWRRLKLAQYQEYIAALSGTVEERVTDAAMIRYTDAVNATQLVASGPVMKALNDVIEENSFKNPHRSEAGQERVFNALVQAMRQDVQPVASGDGTIPFRLIGPPPPLKRTPS